MVLQLAAITGSTKRLRPWTRDPAQQPRGVRRLARSLGVPLVLCLGWALVVTIVLPRKVQAPLSPLLRGLPDLGWLLVGSAGLALTWGLGRMLWTALLPAGARRPRRDVVPPGRCPVRATAGQTAPDQVARGI